MLTDRNSRVVSEIKVMIEKKMKHPVSLQNLREAL
jgi:hypothetical protein